MSDRAGELLDISTSWERDPVAFGLEYHAFMADPEATVSELLKATTLDVRSTWSTGNLPQGRDIESVGVGWRNYLSRSVLEELCANVGALSGRFGLEGEIDLDALPTDADAEQNWRQLLQGG